MFELQPHTLIFRAYRVPVRCWRCWHRFAFFAPNEFADTLLFPCDKCGNIRAMATYGESNFTGVEGKYIDVHYPHLPRSEDEKYTEEFLDVFENSWTSPCECGGRFRLRAPVRCSHCHAPEWRWLRGRDTLVDSPPIPALEFTIPQEYAKAPARPPRYPDAEIVHMPGPPPWIKK